MDNLAIYNACRAVPSDALKTITGGRLKGKSDINPMWRLKILTEQFGPCGIGWKYVITRQWLETGGKDEIAAFVNIDLFVKVDGQWSDAIPGTGGSAFVAKESSGLYTSDECFKMALTDAISVSCKALGVAADVYWDSDSTKYNNNRNDTTSQPQRPQSAPASSQTSTELASDAQLKKLFAMAKGKGIPNADIKTKIADMGKASSRELTKQEINKVYEWIEKYGQVGA